ncbi:hypothetical protein QE250_10420 [Chromatiaceae bacterium AAb-1]|nr:hypothetical protein [Chromatiaceae bacterium AAb-1]
MRNILCLTILLLLTACQHTAGIWQKYPPSQLYADHHFTEPAAVLETADDIFRLPPATEADIRQFINRQQDTQQRTKEILQYIFFYANTGLSYEHTATTTATETLQQREANCLSLSILAYSLAKAAGIQAEFQDIQIPEYWVNSEGQSFLNGHVNLRLKASSPANTVYTFISRDVIVDFDPYVTRKTFPAEIISGNRIVAMFYNNKAAHAHSNGNSNLAYQYYKAATLTDPEFAASWSNLAVLYREENLTEYAFNAYHHSLALQPDSVNTLANLAMLYRKTGNTDKAAELERYVLLQRQNNPYYYVMLGDESIPQQPAQAIKHYKKALTLNTNLHEAYFGLSKSYYLQGNITLASHYMEKARRSSSSQSEQQRYQNKLQLLTQTTAYNP